MIVMKDINLKQTLRCPLIKLTDLYNRNLKTISYIYFQTIMLSTYISEKIWNESLNILREIFKF